MSTELIKQNDAIPAISHGPFTATPVGLVISNGADIPYEVWEAYGKGLGRVGAAWQWVVGDWINFGEAKYGEKYSQAIHVTGLDYETVRKISWVAKKIETVRRRTVPFSHHEEVAALSPGEQEKHLAFAESMEMSRNDFRSYLKEQKRKKDQENRAETVADIDSGLLLGDFQDKGKEIANESVDLCLTDPPYDDASLYLYSDMAGLCSRVLRPGGVCVAYAGIYRLPDVYNFMSNRGLVYMWTISLNYTGGTDIFRKYGVEQGWKALVVYYKPPLNLWWDHLPDVLEGSGIEKELYEWQQGESEAAFIINKLCPSGGVVLDPMMGSGTVPFVAKKLGYQYIGIEKDEERYGIAAGRVAS